MGILHNVNPKTGQVNLFDSFAKQSAVQAIVTDLQGNILKGHDRNAAILFFLQFNREKMAKVKEKIAEMAKYVTSFRIQMEEWYLYHGKPKIVPGEKTLQPNVPGGTFLNFCLTSKGFAALGITNAELRDQGFDKRFIAGIQGSLKDLNDRDPDQQWDPEYWDRDKGGVRDIDAMLLMADDDRSNLGQKVRIFLREVLEIEYGDNLAKIVAVEHAIQRRDRRDQPIEHFGFRDGISNPLFLQQDIEKILTYGGVSRWDPRAPLDLVLVQDPYGKQGEESLGSYLVYRKYEQHVGQFEGIVRNLAKDLGEDDLERVRALMMGRFRDGTPLSVRNEPYGERYLNQNYMNYNFEDDPEGAKCPLHSHTRKVNPRYSNAADKGKEFSVWKPKLEEEDPQKIARIVRRGMTYGKRKCDDEQGRNYGDDESDVPNSGVGLLFMCFQRDIEKQFECIQKEFANKASSPDEDSGIDSVIGQEAWLKCPMCGGTGRYEDRICYKCIGAGEIARPAGGAPKKWPVGWGNGTVAFSNAITSCVSLRGGEYFFAPSISFLKSLFETTLSDADVKGLQKKLGVKSTGEFDKPTREVLEKFKVDNNIKPSDGYLTRDAYEVIMKTKGG